MHRFGVIALTVAIVGCGAVVGVENDAGSGAGGTSGSGGGSAMGGGNAGGGSVSSFDGGFTGLPCDVATLMRTRCISCHTNPPIGGADMPLTSYAELTAASPLGGTYAGRSLARMKDTGGAPMPPSGVPPANEVAAFESWLNSGAPMGTCTTTDGGTPMVTCTSASTWPTVLRYSESNDMNPGLACRSCHVGQNFKNQNPLNRSAPANRRYYFAGTIFGGEHQKDFCNAVTRPGPISIEIYDNAGTMRFAMTPYAASGNFYNPLLTAPSWLPYTVKVKVNGVVTKQMVTPQMNGDCNICHTELGEQGAPGRVIW